MSGGMEMRAGVLAASAFSRLRHAREYGVMIHHNEGAANRCSGNFDHAGPVGADGVDMRAGWHFIVREDGRGRGRRGANDVGVLEIPRGRVGALDDDAEVLRHLRRKPIRRRCVRAMNARAPNRTHAANALAKQSHRHRSEIVAIDIVRHEVTACWPIAPGEKPHEYWRP